MCKCNVPRAELLVTNKGTVVRTPGMKVVRWRISGRTEAMAIAVRCETPLWPYEGGWYHEQRPYDGNSECCMTI